MLLMYYYIYIYLLADVVHIVLSSCHQRRTAFKTLTLQTRLAFIDNFSSVKHNLTIDACEVLL